MKRNLNYAESQEKKKAKSEGREWVPKATEDDPPEMEPVIILKNFAGNLTKKDMDKYKKDEYEKQDGLYDKYSKFMFSASSSSFDLFATGYEFLEFWLWDDTDFKKAGGNQWDLSSLAISYFEK